MRAIILAAGVGRRLGDSVTELPKCLLDIEGRTLLDRMLDALQEAGVRDIWIVVGHLSDQVEAAVRERTGVRTLFNPEFRKGAILSLWTAREGLEGAVLVMDADVLFPQELLGRLVGSPHESCFLMDSRAADDGEAQILMARGGRVLDIARGCRGEWDATGESIGFLKLGPECASALRRLLEAALSEGRDRIEHEEVYPALMRECVIGYELVDDLPWMEIDFEEDVIRARELVRSGKL